MSIAHSLEDYLFYTQIEFQRIPHEFTETAYETALAAHVPIDSMVKAVVLRDRRSDKYVMVLIPASNKLKLLWVNRALQRDLVLAGESEIASLFPDCVLGAVPGLGQAYDMELLWDGALLNKTQLFFEAGNHVDLIKIDQLEFNLLFSDHPHGIFSLPIEDVSTFNADEMRSGMH